MTDLVVIVPSRGRPHAIRELCASLAETAESARLVVAIDEDDPTRHDYLGAISGYSRSALHIGPAPATMVSALNMAAEQHVNSAFATCFMGDDHRPRTVGWDQAYLDALRELGTGMVYGNDLLQGERLPTQIAMTSDIIRTLGFMAPPDFTHLFIDNYWKALGQGAECIRYLPHVVVEHLHPVAGKAEWDEGHRRVNAPAMYQRDANVWTRYRYMNLPGDVAKVRALRASRVPS